ncbi:hypothetical protein [Xenorhabdus lircayensis]|uniref:Uncharacterized protein n=1 Tax=Xenorhabdus lircayensis TaxID=2763499 RepID=A0ABS0U357_9GAMM|nr:hypothetical protein [Xenorhabdus lircayensis]MBI6548321.1 hypothetical protein [Xenorhabdus lircayensis]
MNEAIRREPSQLLRLIGQQQIDRVSSRLIALQHAGSCQTITTARPLSGITIPASL